MDIRQSLAQGGPILLSGTTYTLADPGPGIEGLFSAWLIDNARRRIEAMVRGMEPEQAASYRDSFTGQVGSGLYEWGGKHAREALMTDAGFSQWIWLRLRAAHPSLTATEVMKLLMANRDAFKQIDVTNANPTNGTAGERMTE